MLFKISERLKWYGGVVVAVNRRHMIEIDFDDGSSEKNILYPDPERHVIILSPMRPTALEVIRDPMCI
jgi:hypothetical protein